MKYSPTYSLTWHFASAFGSYLDDLHGIWTTAMLVIGFCEPGGNTQETSCLFIAANAVEGINENYDILNSIGKNPEGRPQLNRQVNRPSGRYGNQYAVPA